VYKFSTTAAKQPTILRLRRFILQHHRTGVMACRCDTRKARHAA